MKDSEEMTVEEIIAYLRDHGVPVDDWQSDPKTEVEITTIPTFERMAEGLTKLGGLLDTQIVNDQKQIQQLNLKLAQIKHGGGR